jgi:hypothetical protein
LEGPHTAKMVNKTGVKIEYNKISENEERDKGAKNEMKPQMLLIQIVVRNWKC